jgi:excinuclease ABC subunit C
LISEDFLSHLPDNPGVYLFRDKSETILYVGKAKSIKDRVKSYFAKGPKHVKTEHLVRAAHDIIFVLTDNEKEAFLLENNLIKQHQPKYNIGLKDDKTYVSLKLSMHHAFPALTITRIIKDDGSLYFGPYPHAKDAKELLKVAQSLYPMRRCRDSVFKNRTRPCILADISKCPAPCMGLISQENYHEMADEMADFLSGRNELLLKKLEEQIKGAADTWKFEEAKAKKEKYLAIKRLVEKQSVHEHMGINRDVWAFLSEESRFKVVLLNFRKGVLMGKRSFKEKAVPDLSDAVSNFLFQYYSTRPIPDEVVLSEDIDDKDLIQHFLSQMKNRKVIVHGPTSKGTADMISLAVENLHEVVEDIDLAKAFFQMLHLSQQPKRIEIFDNSHSHGQSPSGIMVVFEDFKPRKDAYRIFHIRQADPEDDVAMMSEVLSRRLDDENLGSLPDLVIIDGGKAQLAVAVTTFKTRALSVDIMSIAKGEKRKRLTDVIYLPGRKNPLLLPKMSPVFKQIVMMRDEAHRFAIASHRNWKRREDLISGLEAIQGVGKKRAKLLLMEFASLEAIKSAGVEGISQVKGLNRAVAEEIIKTLP